MGSLPSTWPGCLRFTAYSPSKLPKLHSALCRHPWVGNFHSSLWLRKGNSQPCLGTSGLPSPSVFSPLTFVTLWLLPGPERLQLLCPSASCFLPLASAYLDSFIYKSKSCPFYTGLCHLSHTKSHKNYSCKMTLLTLLFIFKTIVYLFLAALGLCC